MVEEIIKFENVSKIYQIEEIEIPALKDVSFSIKAGDHMAIIGPSGSGKTTLLNLLGCLDRPTRGKYMIQEKDVSSLSDDELSEIRSCQIGFIFQNYNLIPQLTVLENIGIPLFYQGIEEGVIREKAYELAKRVGLKDRTNHRPFELSGGQQQRVAVARALINKPVLILADEPTGNLDSVTGKEIMDLLGTLNKEGKTLVVVTHDLTVVEYSRTTIRMLDGKITNEN